MDDALVVLQHGHAGVAAHPPHQLLAAARDDQIDELVELEQRGHRGAVRGVDELHRLGGRPHLLERLGQDRRDRDVRLDRLAASAKHDRVPRLHAETGGVGGDVRPRLVDEPDHAERHPHSGDLEAVGLAPRLDDGAHRIRQSRDLPEPLGHPLDPRLGERQAIEKRLGHPAARALDVGAIGLEQHLALLDEPARHLLERLVLGLRRAERHRARRRPRRPRAGLDEGLRVHHHKITRLSLWITSSKLL